MYQDAGSPLQISMQPITSTLSRHLPPEQLVERERLRRVLSARRASARANRAVLLADLVRLERWAQSGEEWTSTSERSAS